MTLLQVGTRFLDTNSKKILYYAQMYGHLSCGLPIWGNMVNATKLESLQRLQNKCMRKIDINENHVTDTYKKHKILRIKDAILLENCKLGYRLEHQMLPGKLMYLFNTGQKGISLEKTHAYNTRNKKLPNITKTHCKMYSNSYLCSSIRDYQNLNVELTQAKSESLQQINERKLLTQ